MKILIKNIPESAMDYSGEVVCTGFNNNGDDIKFVENIKFEGTLRKGEDFVEILGKVFAKFETSCHACGNMANGEMCFDVFETYRREPGDEEYQLVGNEVDFDDMILENIRLNFPIRILCKEDCKGICTFCGANLNVDKCSCDNTLKGDSPFDVLNKLLD